MKIQTDNIRKYFHYDDRLRRVVSIITGILIASYNLFSGILIVYFFGLLLGIQNPDFLIWTVYFLIGTIAGFILFRFCLLVTKLILKGITIEDYSYLRLLLMVTVIFYLFLTVLYFMISIIQRLASVHLLN